MKKQRMLEENEFVYKEDFDFIFQNLNATLSEDSSSCSEYEGDLKNDTRLHNFIDCTPIALMANKYEVSPRAAAAIANACLVTIGQVQTSEEAQKKFFDHRKVFRKISELCVKNESLRNEYVMEECPDCICFDGKKDFSLVQKRVGESVVKEKNSEEVDHYSVTLHPENKFLTKFVAPKVPPQEGVDKNKDRKGKLTAKKMVEKFHEIGLNTSELVVIGCDSTPLNTGAKGGIIAWFEFFISTILVWSICLLHLNELPLRRVMDYCLGSTKSADDRDGEVYEVLKRVNSLEYNPDFERMTDIDTELVKLPESVVIDLSPDQKLLYNLILTITTNEKVANIEQYKNGPLYNARWVTFATAAMKAYISKHGLDSENYKKLKILVRYIIYVYGPTWFDIKTRPTLSDGPRHWFKLVTRLRKVDFEDVTVVKVRGKIKTVVKLLHVVMENILLNSYWFHSENLLISLLASEDPEDREFAVSIILKIRNGEDFGDFSPRIRLNPEIINFEAKDLKEVIPPAAFTHEPPLTLFMSSEELVKYREVPMVLKKWPCHTQATKRAVKKTSKASMLASTEKKTEGLILTNEVANSLVSKVSSKKDFAGLTESFSKNYKDCVRAPPPPEGTLKPRRFPPLVKK